MRSRFAKSSMSPSPRQRAELPSRTSRTCPASSAKVDIEHVEHAARGAVRIAPMASSYVLRFAHARLDVEGEARSNRRHPETKRRYSGRNCVACSVMNTRCTYSFAPFGGLAIPHGRMAAVAGTCSKLDVLALASTRLWLQDQRGPRLSWAMCL